MPNQLMVVLSDLTAYKTGWETLQNLPQHLEYLEVRVLHQQSPTGNPNQISFVGHDMIYAHANATGLTLGWRDDNPAGHKEHGFDAVTTNQSLNRDVPSKSADARINKGVAQWLTYPYTKPDYDTKTLAAQATTPSMATVV